MNGVISALTPEVAEKTGLMPAALLKQAAVLFDQVFWHRGMLKNIEGFSLPSAEELAAEWGSSYNNDEQSRLRGNRKFSGIFRDVEELAPDLAAYVPDPFGYEARFKDTALWRVGKPIAQRMTAAAFGRTEEEVEAGAVGNTWQSTPSFVEHDFQIVNHLRGRFPDLAGVFTAAHVAIGAALQDARHEPGNPLKVMLEAQGSGVEGIMPDFSAFSWDEILELRTDYRAIAFRRKVADLAEHPAPPLLSQEVLAGLRSLAMDVRPKPVAAAIWGALGMIPAGFNPFGAFSAGDTFRREIQRGVNYNWLYFLIDAAQRQRVGVSDGRRRPHVASDDDPTGMEGTSSLAREPRVRLYGGRVIVGLERSLARSSDGSRGRPRPLGGDGNDQAARGDRPTLN